MEVTGQLHVPAALPSAKQPALPRELEAGWAPEPTLMLWRMEKSLFPAIQPVARHYTY
jgi:hypothetical protein